MVHTEPKRHIKTPADKNICRHTGYAVTSPHYKSLGLPDLGSEFTFDPGPFQENVV